MIILLLKMLATLTFRAAKEACGVPATPKAESELCGLCYTTQQNNSTYVERENHLALTSTLIWYAILFTL